MTEAETVFEPGDTAIASTERTRDDCSPGERADRDLIWRMHQGEDTPSMPLVAALGARCVSIESGLVVASLAHAPRLENAEGLLHARAASALLDATMRAATLTLEHAGLRVVTLDFKVTHLKPVSRSAMPVRSIALVVSRGDAATYVVGELRDAQDRLVAHAVGNFCTLRSACSEPTR